MDVEGCRRGAAVHVVATVRVKRDKEVRTGLQAPAHSVEPFVDERRVRDGEFDEHVRHRVRPQPSGHPSQRCRPADPPGQVEGVGNQGGIYTIKTPPATTDVVITKVSQLQYPLHSTYFGVDFNPAADRLRVISDNGQNLRHNLKDHTTIQDLNITDLAISLTGS